MSNEQIELKEAIQDLNNTLKERTSISKISLFGFIEIESSASLKEIEATINRLIKKHTKKSVSGKRMFG